MNRDFLYTVIVLLVAMVATVKWHHNTDVSEAAALQDSTVFVCNLLGEKLAAKDDYIARLEQGIVNQYELITELKEIIEYQEAALAIEFENDETELEPTEED